MISPVFLVVTGSYRQGVVLDVFKSIPSQVRIEHQSVIKVILLCKLVGSGTDICERCHILEIPEIVVRVVHLREIIVMAAECETVVPYKRRNDGYVGT